MKNEQICEIEFDNFDKNINSTWHQLQNDTVFSDVTLVCDEKLIEAHKIVLASSSPVFENILRHSTSSQQKPFIYLVGMELCDLEPVMDYMYQGKVNIRKEHLKNFLKVAKQLKIEGLSRKGDEQNVNFESGLSQNLVDILPPNEERLPSVFNKGNNSQDSEMYNNDIENNFSLKAQPTSMNDEEMLSSNFNSYTGNNSVDALSPKRQKTKFTSDQRNLSINSENIYHETNTNEIAASSLVTIPYHEVTAPFDIYQSNSVLEHQNLQSDEDIAHQDFPPNKANKLESNFNPLFLNANVQETDKNPKKLLVNNHSGSNQIKPTTHFGINEVMGTSKKEDVAPIETSQPAFTKPKLYMPSESKDHNKIKKELKNERTKKNAFDTTNMKPSQSGSRQSAVFLCELCNKHFTNYKSVWLHKKITHK